MKVTQRVLNWTSMFLLLGVVGASKAAQACQGGACGPISTASQQSNTTSNTNSPTAVSNTTANPQGYATGVNHNTQMVFNEYTRSTFEGVVNIPGGTSVKGAVSCGNNSASVAAFPQMTGDNRWVFSGGLNLSLVKNTIDCRGQQEIVECAQLFALGSSGSYYDKRCGKYGFSRTTPVAADPRPIELRTAAPTAVTPTPILMEPAPSGSGLRQPVRQRF